MAEFLCFYLRCIKSAMRGGMGVIGDFSTAFSIFLAGSVSMNSAWMQNRAMLATVNAIGGWIVPIILFCSISIVRLILAPYWEWKEMKQARDTALVKLDSNDSMRAIKNDLSRMWKRGEDLINECHNYDVTAPQEKANIWNDEVTAFLELRVGETEKDFYLSGQTQLFVFPSPQPPKEHRELMGGISRRNQNLRKILDKLPVTLPSPTPDTEASLLGFNNSSVVLGNGSAH